MTPALDGIKVVDISQVAAVPMTARLMADYGAEVVHVEHPGRGDLLRESLPLLTALESDFHYVWENYNHNKKSIAIDISRPDGQAIVHKLIAGADVLLSNLRPYQLTAFDLEYDRLSELNPGLIFGNLTGYGRVGDYRDDPAYDHIAYGARGGVVHRMSPPAGLPIFGVPAIGDNVASLALLSGIMMALFVRERTGLGQEVDVSLLGTAIFQISWELSGTLATGADLVEEMTKEHPSIREKLDNRAEIANPLACSYRTSDGRWLILIAPNPERYWPKLCSAIEREDLKEDGRFLSKEALEENREEVFRLLEQIFKSKTLAHWKQRLAGFPGSAVQNSKEVIADAQARANDHFVSFDHPEHGAQEMVAGPMKLSKTPASAGKPAPSLGEHTGEILKAHGYTPGEIAQLRRQGVVA